MISAFVSLGSNTDNAGAYLAQARSALAGLEGVTIIRQSPQYQTEPQDLKEQAWFTNQVLELGCSPEWQPENLLHSLLMVESALGRVRSTDSSLRYGPRCIDIDLLLFGKTTCNSPTCQLPHPRMHLRAFVLVPLQDIAPEVSIHGTKLKDLLQRLVYSVDGLCIRQ